MVTKKETETEERYFQILKGDLEGSFRGGVDDNCKDKNGLYIEKYNSKVKECLMLISYVKKNPMKYKKVWERWAKEKNKELKKEKNKEIRKEEEIIENPDLKNFIFDEKEIVKKRVFSSHLINEKIFGFGVLLPRWEDIINKKGVVIGKEQKWRAVILTSNRRGLVVSKWFQNEYKISYDELPSEMKLRWTLKDINDYLHNKKIQKTNGKKLFEEMKERYKKYLYFRSNEWYPVNVLWDLGTYFHQLFSAYPLKENRGLSGSAKTKAMVVSSYMTLNATDLMINPSEATLFRETEILRPTKYIDEAEKLFKFTKEGMESDNRVELINSSYTKNGSVPRQEKIGNKFFTKWYHVYSPTQITSINGLYGATENRAITQVHTKAPDKDERGELDPEDDIKDEIWKIIKNKCYRWALENWEEVSKEYKNFNIKTNLKKRDLQLWKPLLILAKIINKKDLLPEIINFAEKLSEQRKDDNISENTLDYKYLNCVNEILKHTTSSKIYLDEIRKKFSEFYGIEEKPKSNKSISTHLDKLGFKELRKKDMYGAYYELTKKDFDEIISPITNVFTKSEENSSYSSHSSELLLNNKKNMMNNDNNMMNMMNPTKTEKYDEYDENDKNDESLEEEEKSKKKDNDDKVKELQKTIKKLRKEKYDKKTIKVYEKELKNLKGGKQYKWNKKNIQREENKIIKLK